MVRLLKSPKTDISDPFDRYLGNWLNDNGILIKEPEKYKQKEPYYRKRYNLVLFWKEKANSKRDAVWIESQTQFLHLKNVSTTENKLWFLVHKKHIHMFPKEPKINAFNVSLSKHDPFIYSGPINQLVKIYDPHEDKN